MPVYQLQENARAELEKIRRSDLYHDLEMALTQRQIRWSLQSPAAHGETDEFYDAVDRLQDQVLDLMTETVEKAAQRGFPVETVKLGVSALVAEELPLYARFATEIRLFNVLTYPEHRTDGAHPAQRRTRS